MTVSQLPSQDAPVQSQTLTQEGASASTLNPEAFDPLVTVLLETIQRLGFGTIFVDPRGCVTDINPVARDLLERHAGPKKAQNDVSWLRDAVRRISEKATAHSSIGTDSWVTLSGEGDRPLALRLIPLARGNGATGWTVMILVDFDRPPQLNDSTLSRLFGLTVAEARIASQLARGGTAVDMANRNRLSVATIRSQIAAIFQKTNTRRQSELALLLTRAAVLP